MPGAARIATRSEASGLTFPLVCADNPQGGTHGPLNPWTTSCCQLTQDPVAVVTALPSMSLRLMAANMAERSPVW